MGYEHPQNPLHHCRRPPPAPIASAADRAVAAANQVKAAFTRPHFHQHVHRVTDSLLDWNWAFVIVAAMLLGCCRTGLHGE